MKISQQSMIAVLAFLSSFAYAQADAESKEPKKPRCVILDSTNICGQSYTGLPVLEPAFSSVTDFNQKLGQSFLTADSVANQFDQFFGCAKNDVAPLVSSIRFQLSFWCSQSVSEAVKYGCQTNGSPFRLCADECGSSIKSIQTIFDQKDVCKGNQTQIEGRKGLINVMTSICEASKGSQTCVKGTDSEQKHCGK